MLYAIEKYHNQRISENELNASTCNPAKPDPKVQLYLTLSMLNYILERKQEVSIYQFRKKNPILTYSIKVLINVLLHQLV